MAAFFGVAELKAAIDQTITKLTDANLAIVKEAQGFVEATAKKQFTEAHRRGTPTNSAPGTPPSVVTGTLRRSIGADRPAPYGLGGYIGHVAPSVVYSRIQELGGQTGRGYAATLPPRPYMGPTLQVISGQITDIAAKHWRNATTG